MSITRTIECEICDAWHKEEVMGNGFPGWGQLTGKQDENGNTDFGLCPEHLDIIFEFIGNLKG